MPTTEFTISRSHAKTSARLRRRWREVGVLVVALTAIVATASCKSPVQKCNEARVVAHDTWVAYGTALQAAPPVPRGNVPNGLYDQIHGDCRRAVGLPAVESDSDPEMTMDQAMTILTCSGNGMDLAARRVAHGWPQAASYGLPEAATGSAMVFRDKLALFRSENAGLLENGPSNAAALRAGDELVEACLSVDP